jgi:hypothetical protein
MRLLVFGKTGQVARELARIAPDAVFLGRDEADLMDPVACVAAVTASDADAILNAAAWTAVDKAEAEEAAATVVNGDSPGRHGAGLLRRRACRFCMSQPTMFLTAKEATGRFPRITPRYLGGLWPIQTGG